MSVQAHHPWFLRITEEARRGLFVVTLAAMWIDDHTPTGTLDMHLHAGGIRQRFKSPAFSRHLPLPGCSLSRACLRLRARAD